MSDLTDPLLDLAFSGDALFDRERFDKLLDLDLLLDLEFLGVPLLDLDFLGDPLPDRLRDRDLARDTLRDRDFAGEPVRERDLAGEPLLDRERECADPLLDLDSALDATEGLLDLDFLGDPLLDLDLFDPLRDRLELADPLLERGDFGELLRDRDFREPLGDLEPDLDLDEWDLEREREDDLERERERDADLERTEPSRDILDSDSTCYIVRIIQ